MVCKGSFAINMCLIVIIMGLIYTGCKGEEPKSVSDGKSDDAKLISLSLGVLTASKIPSVIKSTVWADNSQSFENLAGEYTETLVFENASDYTGVTGIAKISANAAVSYAWSSENNARPKIFRNLDTIISPEEGSFLYVRVSSESGKTINYYRFEITSIPLPFVETIGISLDDNPSIITLFSSEQFSVTFDPPNATNKKVRWSSSNDSVVKVSPDGIVTALSFSGGGSDRYITGGTNASPTISAASGTATITATSEDGEHTASIPVTATMLPQVGIMDLPPMKDQFADYFMIGNIFRGIVDTSGTGAAATIANAGLLRHFNAITAENAMKPSYLVTGRTAATGAFTWSPDNRTAADNYVDACINNDIAVIGHTLLWHSQNANWIWNQIASRAGVIASGMTKENAINIMKAYITEVVSRYAGRIYSWDVLNEAFPDNASNSASWKDAIRKNASGEGQDANPWYIAIGADFVYEGFKAVRLADPKAILYYNDYNTDMPTRARLIRDMVRDVNEQWKTDPLYDNRKLIEGIGMQEHHNNGITRARIKATIDLFRPLGVLLSVTELDIIAYSQYSGLSDAGGSGASNIHQARCTNDALVTQANLFGQYMDLYLENADIIERVSLWGIRDDYSWRSRGLPGLFDHQSKAKPAYYKVIEALEAYKAKNAAAEAEE